MTDTPSKPPRKPMSLAVRRLLRRTATMLSYHHGIGGRQKSAGRMPRAITLPTVLCLQRPVDQGDDDERG